MKPKISIIVPVYNTSLYLRQCLDSIKNQTLNDIEVIVVDDGSTDSSPAICDEYALDNRFTIYHNPNQGVSETRNFGIQKAQGEYCMFVDSDDWLEHTMCSDMWNAAYENNADIVICGNYNESTVGTTARHLYNGDVSFWGSEYEKEIAIHTLGLIESKISNPSKLDKLTPVWARIYRTSIIKNNNIRYIDLHKLPSECLQFNFEFEIKAKSAFYIDKVLYHYRRNTAQSVTKPYRNDLIGKWNWWIVYEKEVLDKNSLNDDYLRAYYSRICCSVIPLGGNALKLKSYQDIRKECRSFLSSPEVIASYIKFDYSSCPIHWKLFFYSAKHRCVDLFILLTWIMRRILDLRKK